MRKDKAQISEFAGQLTQQYTNIAGLNKALQDLEERIQRLQSQSLRYSQMEQTIGQTKSKSRKWSSNRTSGVCKRTKNNF